MTAEELLKQMSAEPFAEEMVCCVIDPETRVIDVPAEYQLLGVESDEKVERMYFQCPKIVGDNIDLSKLALRVNFRNANDQKDQYIVDDVEISGDNITFSWLLSRRVTQYKGNVSFIVCAVKASGEEITNEWNTTLATAQVLEGLEADITLPEEDTDVVKQLIAVATQKITDVQNATSSANTAASNADIKAQEAANAAEDARGVIDQITKDSYLHTTTQTFVDMVKASPTAYGNAIPEQIEGYIKQDTTKGLQLFDANRISDYSAGGVTLRNNQDGSFTISGSGELTKNFTNSYSLSHEDSIKLFPAGSYQITRKNTYPAIFLQKRVNNVATSINNKSAVANYLEVTQEDEANESYVMQFVFYGTAGSSIVPGTIKPMAWASTVAPQDADWEPYTGRQPSPNPDYPQIVHGVGDMGFFDGELVSGNIDSETGGISSNSSTYVRCMNSMPCKSWDIIRIEYEEPLAYIKCAFYKDDGVLAETPVKYVANKKFGEFTAPLESSYFMFAIQKGSSINFPVASAKHITVTINDKYAVCVKSKGKNLLNLTGEIRYSFGRETIFDNQVTIRPTTDGRSAPGVWFILGDIKKFLGKTIYVKADAIQRSGNYNPRMLLMTIKGNTSVRTYLTYSYSKAGQVMSVKIPDDLDTNEASDLALNMYVNDGSSQVDTDAYAIFTNVYAGLSEPTNEFVPYQSNVTYIPVDYPLFEGDKIVRRNGEYRLLRNRGFLLLDGSDDEKLGKHATYAWTYYMLDLPNAKNGGKAYCNWLKHGRVSNRPSVFIGKDLNLYLADGDLEEDTLESFKNKLKETPMMVVYELEKPTVETLTAEAQKALYSIMSCDEQTKISIVGVPSDAEIQNQFLLPRNEDGALNTTAYCTAKRNEIALEELENATAARLSALETQALQEV